MLLQMFIDGKLVDSSLLSLHKMNNNRERDDYIQGAVNELLENWSDLIEDQNLKPEFFIKSERSFT